MRRTPAHSPWIDSIVVVVVVVGTSCCFTGTSEARGASETLSAAVSSTVSIDFHLRISYKHISINQPICLFLHFYYHNYRYNDIIYIVIISKIHCLTIFISFFWTFMFFRVNSPRAS